MNMFVRRTVLALLLSCGVGAAFADGTPQLLPFAQDWSDAGLITANDSWAGVPGIEGYRGDGLAAATAVDPQTVLAPDVPGVIDVNANQANPNTFTTGGVSEFVLADNVVALAGSGTARAPYLKIYLNTTGASNVTVSYGLRDVDGSADNAVQPVALQYRVGNTGDFTNVPSAFLSDATSGPGQAILYTPITAILPANADNQPLVEVRIMTTDAVGSDEWVGIDDIEITAGTVGEDPVLSVSDTNAAEGDSGFSPFFFTVSLNQPAGAGGVSYSIVSSDGTATENGTDSDYAMLSGGGVIPEGETSQVHQVMVRGDTMPEDNETFFVTVSDPTGAILGDAQGIGTINNDDVVLTPIGTIQGSGQLSPLVGDQVSVEGIVTGRKSNGFFVQTADGEDDGNDATSEGLFVFTGGAPSADAAVGNRVQASGTVVEFIPGADPGQLPLTELGGTVSVTLLTIGNPLPAPMMLSTALPAPDGGIEQLERLEGMRVTAPSFTVIAPTDGSTNEPNATGTSNGIFSVVVTGTPRPFREPGIQFPDPPPAGTIPPIPQWDFNPELLDVVSRAIGGGIIDVATGATIENLVGPLDYGFRRYTLAPDPAVAPTIVAGPAPSAARLPTSDEFTVASYNMERFFDTANDPATGEPVLTPVAFANRLNKASLAIRNFLNAPDILGVVEMENLSTLEAVADKISDDAVAAGQPDPQYVAYLQEGNDVGGIDVGFLVKSAEVAAGIDRVEVVEITQLGLGETWTEPGGDTALLNDRPPLQLDAVVRYADGRAFPITAIVVHQRSLNGAEDTDANGERVRAKRQRQAEYLAEQIDALQADDPQRHITVLGDFNAFEFNDGLTDAMNVVTGTPTPDNETAVAGDGVDLVDPDLLNLYIEEPADQRYSFVFDGNAQSLDHVLINQALGVAASGVTLDHARINADYPEVNRNDANSPSRLSDHDPAIAYIATAVADLSVVVEGDPANVNVGDTATFTATVTNAGPNDAEFPGIGFAIDAELPDLAVDAPAGWTCGTPTVGGGETSVACNADALAIAATPEFTITASAPASAAGQTITLTAVVTSQTQDLDPANDSDSASVAVQAQADLAIVVDGPATFLRNASVEFSATVSSSLGPPPAMTVFLSSNAPSASVETTAPEGWTCDAQPSALYRALCTRDGGPFEVPAFVVSVSTSGKLFPPRITVTAQVESSGVDPDLSNNRSSRTASRARP